MRGTVCDRFLPLQAVSMPCNLHIANVYIEGCPRLRMLFASQAARLESYGAQVDSYDVRHPVSSGIYPSISPLGIIFYFCLDKTQEDLKKYYVY